MIQSSLDLYSADKVGMFDYALETAGGVFRGPSVQPRLLLRRPVYSYLGTPCGHFSNSARTVIQVCAGVHSYS